MIPHWHRLAASCALAIRRHRGRFPEDMTGACVVASVLLGLVYRHHGIQFRFASSLQGPNHSWVEIDWGPVDLTATQFGIDQFVHLRRPTTRFQTFAAKLIGQQYRQQRARNTWHHSEPRRNYDVLVPALSEVLAISTAEARRRVRSYIGPEIRR